MGYLCIPIQRLKIDWSQSPRLDAHGNSVRGILVRKDLASNFGLHAFEFNNVGSSFMRWLL